MSEDNILSAVNYKGYRLEMRFDDDAENPHDYHSTDWHLRFDARYDLRSLSDIVHVNRDYRRGPDYMYDQEDEYEINREFMDEGGLVVPIFRAINLKSIVLIAGEPNQEIKLDEHMLGYGICAGFAYLSLQRRREDMDLDLTGLKAELYELSAYINNQCFSFVLYKNGEELEYSSNWYGDDGELRRTCCDLFNHHNTAQVNIEDMFGMLSYYRIDPVEVFE